LTKYLQFTNKRLLSKVKGKKKLSLSPWGFSCAQLNVAARGACGR